MKRFIIPTIITILTTTALTFAGSLTPPSPTPGATLYTLEDIYQKLHDNTYTATEGGHSFTPPGTITPTFYSLTDIFTSIPTIDPSIIKKGEVLMGVEGTYEASSGPSLTNDGPYTNNGDGTVTDENTGLMWMAEDYDNGDDDYLCWDNEHECDEQHLTTEGASNAAATGDGALAYCDSLTFATYSDWRLPSVRDWQLVTDYSKYEPATDLPNISSDGYWSSTEDANYPNDGAWMWYSYLGDTGSNGKDSYSSVRCLRG